MTTSLPRKSEYPLLSYNYRVVVGAITMRFSKVDGLAWERKTKTYRDGLSFLQGEQLVSYYVDAYSTLTLQQGVVENDTALHGWLSRGDSRPLQVLLCDARGQAVISWSAKKAVPVKLSVGSFDAKGSEVAMDTLEVMASGWSIKHLN
jgi:phage tail-like protein